jgi:anti-anti-sigma factor
MALNKAQVWRSSGFTIERCDGKEPGTVNFRLTGPFTARDMYGSISPTTFREIFECVEGEQPGVHVVDLTLVPYMDSMGLGVIVGHYVRCQGKGVKMILKGASPRVLELFRIAKVDAVLSFSA